MFTFVEPVPERVKQPEEGLVRKRRAGRSGAASLPAARRRRTTTSTRRWAASSLASKRTDSLSASTGPPPTLSQTAHAYGKVPTNDDGFIVRLGTQDGFRGRWYCGRILDPSDVPGASDQCGPEGGPQCHACARFQVTYEPDLNDDGHPVKRSTSSKACYMFYCGRPGVVAGTGGRCGPLDGPQCPSCQRLQQSFKAMHVNDEGCHVRNGTTEGWKGMFYCGRVLGIRAIPDSDGRCGPADGPQCASCQRFQKTQQVIIDDDTQPSHKPVPASTAPLAMTEPAPPRPGPPEIKVKREIFDDRPAEASRPSKPARRQDPPQAPPANAKGAQETMRSGKETKQGRQSARSRQEDSPDPPRTEGATKLTCSVCGLSDRPDQLLLCDGSGPICRKSTHLGCCDPPLRSVPAGDWYCVGCQYMEDHGRIKCSVCGEVGPAEELLLCDAMWPGCEIATHLSCCKPPLKSVPEGDWFCGSCHNQRTRKRGRPERPKSANGMPQVPRAPPPQAAQPKSTPAPAHESKGVGKGGGKGKGSVRSLGAALKVAAAEVHKPRTLD